MTAALAFIIAAAVLTLPELIAGQSLGKGNGTTSILGNNRHRSSAQPEQTHDAGPRPDHAADHRPNVYARSDHAIQGAPGDDTEGHGHHAEDHALADAVALAVAYPGGGLAISSTRFPAGSRTYARGTPQCSARGSVVWPAASRAARVSS